MILRFFIFLLINFGALAIGSLFTNKGVASEWYISLQKAPWTPPGWMFGLAWTTIMLCFSFYMSYLWSEIEDKKFIVGLFALQWILNVAWNPVFFHIQNTGLALLIIILLTLVVGFICFYYMPLLKVKTLLILPYFIWLLIATSLNMYIVFKN